MLDLITIGDSLVDIFFIIDDNNTGCFLDREKKKLCFNYAEKMSIEQSTHAVGGNATNVAVGAKKLGLQTAIITELGDDINGQVVLETLQKTGLDLSLLTVHKNKETRYSVVLNYKSERTILSYQAERFYTLPELPKTKWIYYTSLGKNFERLQKQLVFHLKKHPDIKLAMNPGSYQIANGLTTIKKMLPLTSLLIVNKEEATKIINKTTRTGIKTMLRELSIQGPHTVVITDGIQGSYGIQDGNIFHMSPYPIQAKGKAGAGDAYTSGFLSATIFKKTIEEAMMWGTANAGGVIREFGAQKGLLKRRQIEKMLTEHKSIYPINI